MPNRHHMDHFRGATLSKGGEVLYNDLEVYLACHEKSNHRKHWHGYFLIPAADHLTEDGAYKIVLPDKREGEINLGELKGCESAGGAFHAVDFHVVGELHNGVRRRLETKPHL